MKSECQESLPYGSYDTESPEPLFVVFDQLFLPVRYPLLKFVHVQKHLLTFKNIKYFEKQTQINIFISPCSIPFSGAVAGSLFVHKSSWLFLDP